MNAMPYFENDTKEVIANLHSPDFKTTVNISMPSDWYVINSTMLVSDCPMDIYPNSHLESIGIEINASTIWAFRGKGIGPLGMQDRFFNDNRTAFLQLGASGGSQQSWIRLPKNSTVQNATMQMTIKAPSKAPRIITFPGEAANDHCAVVSNAGDVNQDGYDDVIIGSAYNDAGGTDAGRAYILFGGKEMDNISDVIITGGAANNELGGSVSHAGDVNGDDYPDLIVTADGNSGGYVSIYYGGKNMDNVEDVRLNKPSGGDGFGYSASDAGDLNGDGYDDVAVGAPYVDSQYDQTGAVYVYYGGQNMDSIPDLVLYGEGYKDFFGDAVDCAGDMNGDGYDDIIVGAPFNKTAGSTSGSAYLYFGGQQMDNSSDVIFRGTQTGEYYGYRVSAAGDVNRDGFDDVIIGASGSGHARIFFGGSEMDNVMDVELFGSPGFGWGCSGAGDVDSDGYDDIIVGDPGNSTLYANGGCAHLYYGNKTMNNISAMRFFGDMASANLGSLSAVSGAGDVNGDGYDEIILGAPNADANGDHSGYAVIYNCIPTPPALLDPDILIGSKAVWNHTGFFKGGSNVPDFSKALNDYLRNAPSCITDDFGNCYIDIPIAVHAKNEGNFTLTALKINYTYASIVPNFSSKLNEYLNNHRKEKDINGNITVPLTISSSSAGHLKLSGLEIKRDMPPNCPKPIPNKDLDEDTAIVPFLDLHQYFQDDSGPSSNLTYSIVSATNSSLVRLWITVNKYLSVDAMTGDANDNWTGTVEAVVACTDPWGQRTESNPFVITIRNVNDPPIITSIPPTTAARGQTYYYNATAIDGDNDTLTFSLPTAPDTMTVGPRTGIIKWTPTDGGLYPVNLTVTDGNASDTQLFNISVPFANRPPRIMNTSIPEATVGRPYSFQIPAIDDDGDTLSYLLMSQIANMTVDSSKGVLSWTPTIPGTFPVSVRVSDGEFDVICNFSIPVKEPGTTNRQPVISSKPSTTAAIGIAYIYDVKATDPDKDALAYSLLESPPGMVIDPSSGRVSWTPMARGNFTVKVKVSDGKGGEAVQEFRITVLDRLPPALEFSRPYENEKVRGKIAVAGTATKGTLDIIKIQIRIDSGEWLDAAGTATWTFSLDTSKLKNGNHKLSVRAYDGTGYSEVVDRTIIVDNPKPPAKGFIPSYGGILLTTCIMLCLIIRKYRLMERR
jgi:hypothetical protein